MGCFNSIGFLSKTPIRYHDDIVIFICAGYAGIQPNVNPLNTIDQFSPIALPIFGKYNEYGGIEDVIIDTNTNYLSQAFNCNIEKFIEYLTNCADIPLKTLRTMAGSDPFRDPAYTKIANIISELGETKYENCTKPSETDENNISPIDTENPYIRDNMYLTYCMEHKSIFDILVRNNNFTEYRDGYVSFNKLLHTINRKINILYDINNELDIFDIITDIRYKIHKGDADLSVKIHNAGINLSSILHRDFRSAIHHDCAYDLIAYNKCEFTDLHTWQHLIFDFIDFSYSLDNIGGYYCHSAYGSQTIAKYKNLYNELFSECLEITKKLVI